jgi:AI-2 transport protein TqsA
MSARASKSRPKAAAVLAAPGLQGSSLLVLAVVAAGFVLHWLQGVLIPFTLALGLYILLSPAVDRLQDRLRMHRVLAIAIVFVLGLGLVVGLGMLGALSVQTFLKSLQSYQASLQDLAGRWDAWLQVRELPNSRGLLGQAAGRLPLMNWAQSLSGGVVGLFLASVLTALFLAFFLLGGRIAGHGQSLGQRVMGQVRKYLAVKLLTSFLTGLLTAGWLSLLGVDLAVLFGLLAFFLNFIPNIGSAIAVLLPLPVALLQFGPSPTLLLAALLPGITQFSIGSVLEPRVMGRALGLHPVTVLLCLLVWGSLWGGPGMLMAVPMTAAAKLMLERGKGTQHLARWMEGDFS